jgi:serine O-acetyltransferase
MSLPFKQTVIADLKVLGVPIGDDASLLGILKHLCSSLILFPGFACVFCYRVNKIAFSWSPSLANLMNIWRFYAFGNEISFHADIGPGLWIRHLPDIVIGGAVTMGSDCHIYHGVTIGAKGFTETHLQPTIGEGARIGTGAKIVGKITLGDYVTVGALTFCDKSIPGNSVVYGNPLVIKPKDR